jgi:hypothetical protein
LGLVVQVLLKIVGLVRLELGLRVVLLLVHLVVQMRRTLWQLTPILLVAKILSILIEIHVLKLLINLMHGIIRIKEIVRILIRIERLLV